MNREATKALAHHIGTALRHTRTAQDVNIKNGSAARIVRELQYARSALDDAERLAERDEVTP